MIWTKDRIRELLITNDLAVERGIVVIFRRQTSDEQQDATTRHHNKRGFSSAHAKMGAAFARLILRGQHLTGHTLTRARKVALHYVGQITEQANINSSAKNGVDER